MLSFLGRGKGGGESGGVGSASDPSSAAPRPDAPASNLAGADAVEISLQATLEGHTDRVWCVAWEPQPPVPRDVFLGQDRASMGALARGRRRVGHRRRARGGAQPNRALRRVVPVRCVRLPA